MTRKKKFNEESIMKATEDLLLERGYDHFHFKALAERLEISRSTIYEYYANKEELIKAYMQRVMNSIFVELMLIESIESPLDQLKQLLNLFLRYYKIRHVFHSPEVVFSENMQDMMKDLQKIREKIVEIIQKGKKMGYFRSDIPEDLIVTLIFYTIEIPHLSPNGDMEATSEYLYKIYVEGIKN